MSLSELMTILDSLGEKYHRTRLFLFASTFSLLSPFLDIFRLGKCDPLEYIFNNVSHPRSDFYRSSFKSTAVIVFILGASKGELQRLGQGN